MPACFSVPDAGARGSSARAATGASARNAYGATALDSAVREGRDSAADALRARSIPRRSTGPRGVQRLASHSHARAITAQTRPCRGAHPSCPAGSRRETGSPTATTHIVARVGDEEAARGWENRGHTRQGRHAQFENHAEFSWV